jgi:hypothetical protein
LVPPSSLPAVFSKCGELGSFVVVDFEEVEQESEFVGGYERAIVFDRAPIVAGEAEVVRDGFDIKASIFTKRGESS